MTKFKKGDRVRLNKEWGRWNDHEHPVYPVGRSGVVTGFGGVAMDTSVARVRFDGNKTTTYFHVSFLSKIRKAAFNRLRKNKIECQQCFDEEGSYSCVRFAHTFKK